MNTNLKAILTDKAMSTGGYYCVIATAWNTNRTLCIADKEIQAFRQKWRVYTPVGDSYDFHATTEHNTLEDAITAAFAARKADTGRGEA